MPNSPITEDEHGNPSWRNTGRGSNVEITAPVLGEMTQSERTAYEAGKNAAKTAAGGCLLALILLPLSALLALPYGISRRGYDNSINEQKYR